MKKQKEVKKNLKKENDIDYKINNATYSFGKQYYDVNKKSQYIKVILEIDYINKKYSIIPGFPTNGRNEFGFLNGHYKINTWLAVLDCIREATEFAKKEVKE